MCPWVCFVSMTTALISPPCCRQSSLICPSCPDTLSTLRMWPLLLDRDCVWTDNEERMDSFCHLLQGLSFTGWPVAGRTAVQDTNTAQRLLHIEVDCLWRGKFTGPPWDLRLMLLCDVPSLLSLSHWMQMHLWPLFLMFWVWVYWNQELVSASLKLLDLIFYFASASDVW